MSAKPDEVYLLEHENPYKQKASRPAHSGREMKMAAAEAIAGLISDDELSADYIIPKAFDPIVGKAVAEAVAEAARKTNVARI